jgi:glycosyltransferase involved in cell wall biosynthesis
MAFGGAEVLVHDFLRATRGDTWQAVACLDAVGPLGESLRSDGVRVDALGRREGFDPRMALRLRSLIEQERPDVVCAHQYTPWSYAAMAVATARVRPALTFIEHGRHYPDQRRPKRVVANRAAFLRVTGRVLAVCSYIKGLLVENEGIPASCIDVVYNGVDPTRFDPAAQGDARERLRAELGLRPGQPVAACVARLHPVKDHPTLVRGFAHAVKRVPDAHLLVVGAGDTTALRGLAGELGVADHITFTGARRDIPAVYAAADVFTMASLSEGTSVTLLESMLLERPAAVTDVGGNPEIVERHVTGLLSPRGDAEALGDSLATLLADRERAAKMGTRGRARVLERFTQQRMHAAWLGAFNDLVAMRGR